MFFFFNDTATTEIYTLSLHDALPIYMGTQITPAVEMTRKSRQVSERPVSAQAPARRRIGCIWSSGRSQPHRSPHLDRKSTRLNSSHLVISYAVFCLKKKTNELGATTC